MRRQFRIERVRAVEREYQAATLAGRLLSEHLQRDPAPLGAVGLQQADFRNLLENLESTFLIRMFAECEAALRDTWRNCFRRPTQPAVKDLLDAIAAYRSVPQHVLDTAHDVRRFRNALVHEEAEAAETLTLAEARRRLCRFLAFLPLDW